MLKSVLIILILALSAMVAENFFAHGKIWQRKKDGTSKFVFFRSVKQSFDSESWKRVWLPAIAVGAVRYLTEIFSATWFLWIALAAFVAIGAYYVSWYYRDGDRLRELIPFWPILYIVGRQIQRVGGIVAPTLKSDVVTVIFTKIIPELALFVFGILLVICFWRKWQKSERELYKWIAIILAIILAISAIALCVNAFRGLNKASTATTQDSKAKASQTWYHFYNTDVQYDGDDDNNYNFGPNPYNADWVAEDYDQDFRERLKKDPALGAADLAWFDANMGTRFLGEFYDSCKGDWAKTMNEAKVRFMNDQSAYYKNLDAFFAYLDSAVKVEVRECKSVSDQMYMNPHTLDGVPDVIVLLTDDHSGHELVYTFEIKGDTFEVAYRIECGFQPTDVAEIMGITPQNQSTPGTPSTPDNPNPPSPNPPGPTPDDPKKDPSKLTPTNTEPNDNRGPGENTIDPNDPNHSTKDRSDNSTSYPSYDKYREDMDHKAEVNQNQRVGGDSNQPSTETPTGTTVDNNGATGTGYGSADTPTPVTAPATEAGTGQAITNNSSNAATAWGDGSDPT